MLSPANGRNAMDWMAQVDAYCERTDFSFWSEPVNALTNLGYLLVALWALRALRDVPQGRVLAGLLLAISIGSFLFHTLATNWAGMADSLPIGLFILVYIFAFGRHVLGYGAGLAAAGVLAFFPFAAAVVWAADQLPFFAISNFYWSVPLLMAILALTAAREMPVMRRGLGLAAGLLCLSITLRSFDMGLCAQFPLGTHFAWHLINAAMFVVVLGAYRAQMLAAHGARR